MLPEKLKWIERHPGLFLLLIAIALMAPYLLQPDVFMWPRSDLGTDFLHYRWSSISFFQDSVSNNREFPLWYGNVMGGSPIPGNPSIFLYYPPQLLMALLPIPLMTGFAILAAFHYWIAGIGGYVLAHQASGLRREVALLAGLAMMLIPRLSSNMVADLNVAYSMCWAPLTIAWTWLAFRRAQWHWTILTGMSMAFSYVIHVQFFYYTALVIGMVYAYFVIFSWRDNRSLRVLGKPSSHLLVMVVICIGLAAFNLLPFITYLDYLSRETLTLAEANRDALPPGLVIFTIIPISLKFPEWEIYSGLLIFMLAPLAALSPRRRETRFWLVVALIFALLSLGTTTPLFSLAFHLIPGMRWLRVPSRMWLYTSIALVMLMAFATETLLQPESRALITSRWRSWLFRVSPVVIILTIAGRFFTRQAGQLDWLLGFAASIALVVALLGIYRWLEGRISPQGLMAALLIGLCLDLIPLDAAFIEPKSTQEAFQVPAILEPVLTQRDERSDPFRIYAARFEVPNHIAVKENLDVVQGMNSFQFEHYVQMVRLGSGCDIPGFAASSPPCVTNEISQVAYLDSIPDPQILGLLNTRYVITPIALSQNTWNLIASSDDAYLYENPAAFPRAYAVGAVDALPDQDAVFAQIATVDLRRVALVEDQVDLPLPTHDFFVEAAIFDESSNNIRVEIEMPDDGILVLSEVWTPGWHATVDGQDAEVLRVNGTLRGVLLSEGRHTVEMRFLPTSFVIGLAITGVSILICVGMFVWSVRQPSGNTA